MRPGLNYLACCLMLCLCGCPPHGPLSLRQEALARYLEACQVSDIGSILATGDPASLPPEERLAEASDLAAEALDIDPFFFPAHLLLVQLLAFAGRNDECREHVLYMLAYFPDEVLVRNQAAWIEVLQDKNPEAALQIVDAGIARAPDSVELRTLRLEIMVEAGRPSSEILPGIEALTEIRDLAPGFWHRTVGLCAVLFSRERSEAVAGPLLQLSRHDPAVLRSSVPWLFAAGLQDVARDFFVYAAGLGLANRDLKIAAARLLVRLEESAAAQAHVDGLLAEPLTESQAADVLALQGFLDWQAGDREAALAAFRRILDADPAHLDGLEGFWLAFEAQLLVPPGEARDRLSAAAAAVGDPAVEAFLREKLRSLQGAAAPSEK